MATLQLMRELILKRYQNEDFITLGMQLHRLSSDKSRESLIQTVDNWIRKRYRYESEYVETLRDPQYMYDALSQNGLFVGDCDDVSMMLATIYKAMGIRVRLVALKSVPDPDFDHVLVEAYDGVTWWVVDPTVTQELRHEDYGRMVVNV